MKKLLASLLMVLISSASNADGLEEKISKFTSSLIPGEGYTETSIDIRENYKSDFSILAVRELMKINDGNVFTQFSFFNTDQNNKEKIIGNFGIGSRKLLNDKTLLVGYNAFFDNEFNEENRRASLGFEIRNSVLDFHSNIYEGLQDTQEERVLDGWDYTLASQVPYLHWSKIFMNQYKWDGVIRNNIKGTKLGSEMILTPVLNLEIAYDDKDKKGLDDELYAKIQFIYPPRNNGPTALDGISKTAWKENKDMTSELLSKVKRNNKIMIEFNGSATVSRGD